MRPKDCRCGLCDGDSEMDMYGIASKPKMILKKEDTFSAYGDQWKKILVENPPSAIGAIMKAMMMTEELRESEAETLAITDDEAYSRGYDHGKANTKDSILWPNKMYQMGYKDGEGDRLYE